MKLNKRLVHALPLVAILGVSGIVVAGNVIINNNQKTSATGEDGIAMTVTGNLDFEITPEVGGTYTEKTIDVTVDTANRAGYTLYMASKNSSNAVADGEENGIVSVSESVAKTEMPINSWGYFVGGDAVNPIPNSDTPDAVKVTEAPSDDSNKTTIIGIGVKVSPNLHSGNYENILTLSAVPNTPCEGFYCIRTMQEMTPEVCDATTTPLASANEVTFEQTNDNTKIPRTILTDTRDNKKYLISKFADGRCWMSQNLELELSSSVTLTSVDTDLNMKDSWTPDRSTGNSINELQTNGYDDSYEEGYWSARSFHSSTPYLRGGITAANSASTDDGKSEWEKVGIYYNGIAATAGSIEDLYNNSWSSSIYEYDQSAKDSICPKGWKLPSYDWYASYIVDFDVFNNAYDEEISSNRLHAFGELLAFNGSGEADGYDDNISSLGSRASYWTSGLSEYIQPYTSYIRNNDLSTSSVYVQNGLPVRCIAR